MEGLVALRLCVHPDECGERHPRTLEQLELLERGGAGTGVRGDGEPGFAVRERRGNHEFRVNCRERTFVNADLHQRRLDPCTVDASFTLAYPSRGYLFSGLVERMRREVLVLRGPVIARVRQDMDLRRLGQSSQQPWIAAQVGRRALDQRFASQLPGLLQVRQHRGEDGVCVVSRRIHLGGADEIHEDVLVHQRNPEPIRRDRTRNRLDPIGALEAESRTILRRP